MNIHEGRIHCRTSVCLINWKLSVKSISVLKLQCTNSATRGRIILLSPATSLCPDMEKISHHHLRHLIYTYCMLLCVWVSRSGWERMHKQKTTEKDGSRRHKYEDRQRQVGVPWLWEALFAEIHPHPLTHMSVDLHQAAHSPVTYLMTTTTQLQQNPSWNLFFALTHLGIIFISLCVLVLMHSCTMAGFSALFNAATGGRPVCSVVACYLIPTRVPGFV